MLEDAQLSATAGGKTATAVLSAVDSLKGTDKVKNLKELRVQHKGKPYRVFFAFDPLRQAVMLCGGDKTGNKQFYESMIPVAEREFMNYLHELE